MEAFKLQGDGVVTGKWFPGSDWKNKVGICDWPGRWTISSLDARRIIARLQSHMSTIHTSPTHFKISE